MHSCIGKLLSELKLVTDNLHLHLCRTQRETTDRVSRTTSCCHKLGNCLSEIHVFFLLVYRFETILSIEPLNARAASNLALVYLDLQNVEKSEEMFLRTLQIDPTYRSTLYNLGVLYNRQKRYSEAMELLSKLATLYPDHLNGVQLLGDCYLRLQQQKKAEEMYKLVLRQNPNHTTALHNLGQFILDDYKSLQEHTMTSFYYSSLRKKK